MPPTPTSTPRLTVAEAAERIVTWLREHPVPYSRADIVAACRVPDEYWLPAIHKLEIERLVVKTGEKRGTKYRAVLDRGL